MLLAFWPAIIAHSRRISSGHAGQTAAQRAIHGKEVSKRRDEIFKDKANRLQELENGDAVAGDSRKQDDYASLSASDNVERIAANRVSRDERTLSRAIPATSTFSIEQSGIISFPRIDETIKLQAARKKADEDDEMVLMIILGMI